MLIELKASLDYTKPYANKQNPNYMILCIRNLKNSTRSLLEVGNTFSKVSGYKIGIQKQEVILFIMNTLRNKSRKQLHSPLLKNT